MIEGRFTVKRKVVDGGMQLLYSFENGYGASVIQHNGSYGNEIGKWEIAVLDNSGGICYDTPITDDVLGHLSFGDVEDTRGEYQNYECFLFRPPHTDVQSNMSINMLLK